MEQGSSGWKLTREWLGFAAAVIVIPIAVLAVVRQMLLSKVWPASFFKIGDGRARKHPTSTPPQIAIYIPVRLHCRVSPGVDTLYMQAFGRKFAPTPGAKLTAYASPTAFSYEMDKGKTPFFDLNVLITGIPQDEFDAWQGEGVELVMEHGWRTGRRAIKKAVRVSLPEATEGAD